MWDRMGGHKTAQRAGSILAKGRRLVILVAPTEGAIEAPNDHRLPELARFAADLPAFIAASPAERAAEAAPEIAELAARLESRTAPFAWLVEAARFPALFAFDLASFRFRVAAPFFAAA
jgi:hypothetical protein